MLTGLGDVVADGDEDIEGLWEGVNKCDLEGTVQDGLPLKLGLCEHDRVQERLPVRVGLHESDSETLPDRECVGLDLRVLDPDLLRVCDHELVAVRVADDMLTLTDAEGVPEWLAVPVDKDGVAVDVRVADRHRDGVDVPVQDTVGDRATDPVRVLLLLTVADCEGVPVPVYEMDGVAVPVGPQVGVQVAVGDLDGVPDGEGDTLGLPVLLVLIDAVLRVLERETVALTVGV